MTEAQKKKRKFRTRKNWKLKKLSEKKRAENKDEITLKPLRKGWQLHHMSLDETQYEKGDTDSQNDLWLKKLARKILKEMATEQEKDLEPVSILNRYLSDQIIRGYIIRNRTKRTLKTVGWYDPVKGYIYLPYKTYFETIDTYFEKHFNIKIPYGKPAFQKILIEEKILFAKRIPILPTSVLNAESL